MKVMKVTNLMAVLMTALLLCLGNVAVAKDLTDEMVEVTVVNVNEADAATLANVLVGVGFSRAQAIVAYREQHGPFYTAEELTAVKGIGQSTVERNLSRITLK